MAWPINPRPAKSLVVLRDQLNTLFPKRSKASDGMLGDTAHQATSSDHNPDANGVVKAFDITHDPANGVDIVKLGDILIQDSRTNYVIRNRQIWQSGSWKPYTGINPHDKHLHLSVKGDYDNLKEWSVFMLPPINKGDVINIYDRALNHPANENDIAYWTGDARKNDWKGFVYDLINRQDFVGNLPTPVTDYEPINEQLYKKKG